MLERNFQASLIKELKKTFKGCIVLKTDPNYIQGIPDLLILYKKKWAALEVKKSLKASHRPNQDYYISIMNKMSFASFISPENKKEILNELCKTFEPRRTARIPRSKQVPLDKLQRRQSSGVIQKLPISRNGNKVA